jgi:hypothetical protein
MDSSLISNGCNPVDFEVFKFRTDQKPVRMSSFAEMFNGGSHMSKKDDNGTVERWARWELELKGPDGGNPFLDNTLEAVFTMNGENQTARGFYDGDGTYRIRFMPNRVGRWSYTVASTMMAVDGLTGSFECVEPSAGNHGPVRVANTFHFAYEDGSRYIPVGTTCYAWTHQPPALEEKTLSTLGKSAFNKIRMCVFPKYYDFNHDEPELFPFEGSLSQGWDFTRFNPAFFRHLETRIDALQRLGVEADLILFHPYDHWGFSLMPAEIDDRYLRYIVARLSAYRNVWWSLANEYDLFTTKTVADWERIAGVIMESDAYGHLRSIHNCHGFYDHRKDWITHCSIQRTDVYKTSEMTAEWRDAFRKPIVIDECAYEGNINLGWGNITGFEMVRRFWEGFVRGGYVGHGETFLNPEEILWWSKGGSLRGESPKRIAFLRTVMEEGPDEGITPISFGNEGWDLPCGGVENSYYLFYFGFNQPSFRTFRMPENQAYRVDVIDTWNMKISALKGERSGNFRIELPGKPYMAVRMRRVR